MKMTSMVVVLGVALSSYSVLADGRANDGKVLSRGKLESSLAGKIDYSRLTPTDKFAFKEGQKAGEKAGEKAGVKPSDSDLTGDGCGGGGFGYGFGGGFGYGCGGGITYGYPVVAYPFYYAVPVYAYPAYGIGYGGGGCFEEQADEVTEHTVSCLARDAQGAVFEATATRAETAQAEALRACTESGSTACEALGCAQLS